MAAIGFGRLKVLTVDSLKKNKKDKTLSLLTLLKWKHKQTGGFIYPKYKISEITFSEDIKVSFRLLRHQYKNSTTEKSFLKVFTKNYLRLSFVYFFELAFRKFV